MEIAGRVPINLALAALADPVQTQKLWEATWTTMSTFCIGMAPAILSGR
jgi:hypothetical protein